jgi:hypothetical protein
MDHPSKGDAEIASAVFSILFSGLHSSLSLSMLLAKEILSFSQLLSIRLVSFPLLKVGNVDLDSMLIIPSLTIVRKILVNSVA